MSVEEEYQDVLQNIETAILGVYRKRRDVLDYDVEDALKALDRHYSHLSQGREPRPPRFDERTQQVFDGAKTMCEWRLGRSDEAASDLPSIDDPLTFEEMRRCLKRLQKSVRLWNKEGGRQGYLQFIEQQLP